MKMNDKIEVEEYIRTEKGIIGQLININEFRPPESKYGIEINNEIYFTGDNELKTAKHSKNIAKLLEIGDYINGCKVLKIEKEKGHITVGQEVNGVVDYNYIFDNEIETIVTKEQFKEMEYRV